MKFTLAGDIMGKGTFLGEFEQLVLLAVIRLDGNAYGVTIRDTIDDYTGRDVLAGQVYTALDRLADKGYVHSRVSDPVRTRGGRSRKLFWITAAGRKALIATRQMVGRMADGLVIEPRGPSR